MRGFVLFRRGFTHALFYALPQSLSQPGGSYAESVHAQTQLLGQLFAMIDFRVLLFLIVRDYHIPIRLRQLACTLFQASIRCIVFVRLRESGWNHGRDSLPPQALLKNVDRYASEEIRRVPDVCRPDLREFSCHAIEGFVGELIRNAYAPAFENFN